MPAWIGTWSVSRLNFILQQIEGCGAAQEQVRKQELQGKFLIHTSKKENKEQVLRSK